MTPPTTPSAQTQLRHGLVVLLTVNSGATDAFGFLALGGAFTSVMTGNMVLIGVAVGEHDTGRAAHAGAAIICFVLGCALGTRLAGVAGADQGVWPSRVNRALAVELGLLVIQAVGWWVCRADPTPGEQLVLLSLNASALGIQSSAVQRFGVGGLSTTYMTGILTTLVVRLASGQRVRDVANSAQLLAGLIGGAALMALLTAYLPACAPVVQLLCVGGVLGTARLLAVEANDRVDLDLEPA